MNAQQIPVRVEEASQFATSGVVPLSRIATDATSIVPPEAPVGALPAGDAVPEAERQPARWPLVVIAVGLGFSLTWSLGLAWLVGLMFGVW